MYRETTISFEAHSNNLDKGEEMNIQIWIRKYIKYSLVSIPNKKFFVFILSRLRFPLLLRIIKFLPEGKIRYFLTESLSPNHIRKILDYKFKEKIKVVKDNNSGTILYVDINNEVGYRYFLGAISEQIMLTLAEQLELDSSHIYLDIGAHIGTTCIPIAKKFNVEVIAVEASPQNASLLLKNIARNKVLITLYQFFTTSQSLANKERYIQLFTQNGNTGANSKFKNWNNSKTFQDYEIVRTKTLDLIISDEEVSRIRLIKIDVEGAEAEVLAGFEKIKNTNAVILFEYRIDLLRKYLNRDGEALITTLENFFILYGVEYNRFGRLSLFPFDYNKSTGNAIGLPKNSLETHLKAFN